MPLNVSLKTTNNTAIVTLAGEVDATTAPTLKEAIDRAINTQVTRLVLMMQDLEYMSSAGLRILISTKQKMGMNRDIYLVGAQEMILDTLTKTGFISSVIAVDHYDLEVASVQ